MHNIAINSSRYEQARPAISIIGVRTKDGTDFIVEASDDFKKLQIVYMLRIT